MKSRFGRLPFVVLALFALPAAAFSVGCSSSSRGSTKPDLGLSSHAAKELGDTAEKDARPATPSPNHSGMEQEAVAMQLTDQPSAPPIQLASATLPVQDTPPAVTALSPESLSSQPKQKETFGAVRHISTEEFEDEVLNSDAPVLVDFYADWCGPCRRLGPTLNELASRRTDVKVVKVNIDHSPEIASRYKIRSIPAIMSFRHGEVVNQKVGLTNLETLQKMLVD